MMSKSDDDLRDRLLRLVDAGSTVAEAARHCGLAYHRAYHQVRQARGRRTPPPDPGDAARLRRRLARGETVRAAAAALGMPETRAYALARTTDRRRRAHAPATRAQALAWLRTGENVPAVAERLALPANTVRNWARAEGLRGRGAPAADSRARFRAALADGLSVPRAAARAGIGTTTAYRWARADRAGAVMQMPVRALPVARWPAALADAAGALAREERLAIGRLCGTLPAGALPGQADVARFLAVRGETLAPTTAARERRHLLSALRKALPGTGWMDEAAEPGGNTERTRTPGGRPRTISLPIDAWPAPQRTAWRAARDPGYLHPGDAVPFAPGPLAQLSAATLAGMEKAYGLYLHSRVARGKAPEVTPVGVQVFVDACRARGNRPRSIATYVADLYAVARVVQPDADLDWLRRTRNRLTAAARQAPKKKWDHPPVDPAVLWSIGCDLIARAGAGPRESRRAAARFRDGVLFLLLSSAPVRLENLAAIAIGTNLVLPADRPGELVFARTKAGHGSRHPLWPELRAAIEVYLDSHRPILLAGAESDALWIGLNGGRPLSQAGLARRIERITRLYLGRALSPHRFRDAVATALVIEHPEAPDLASAMLQHRSPASLQDYTEQGRTVGAARVLGGASAAALARARREARRG